MKACFLTVIVTFIVYANSYGQEKIDGTKLVGVWVLDTVISPSQLCEPKNPFPIKEFSFKEDRSFTLIGIEDRVTGKYQMLGNVLRMFDAFKNETPQEKEEKIEIKELNSSKLIILLLQECATQRVVFKRKN